MTYNQFTQKYAIVSFLDSIEPGVEFTSADWPPHITIADVFAVSGDIDFLTDDLRQVFNNQSSLSTHVISEEWFGECHDVHVGILEKTHELADVHRRVVEVLDTYAVVFNNPEYAREGYKPHKTLQVQDKYVSSERFRVRSLSLVDMFPGEDPYARRVVATVCFES